MDLDLSKVTHVHFIGIGGIGISAIARMMLHDGKKVSGQDMHDSEILHELGKAGADITVGQSYEAIPTDADLIVYTIAIETYDPELFNKLKTQTQVPIRSYPQMLTVVSQDKYTIAVSGTHGKTTTTGMITQVLREMGQDPTVVIGSLLVGEKSNFIAGKSKYFVVEACEYRRSFLNINPSILVITNIDEDHLDYYKDIEDIKSAFRELAMKVPSDGFVVCNPNDKNIQDVVSGISATVVDCSTFFDEKEILKVPGTHNKKNASCVKAVASIVGLDSGEARIALSHFPGTWRRFEFKGNLENGAMIYDDYAHHPAEIVATLQGFRELYPKEGEWHITVLFQPHLFSRTKMLLQEFAQSFTDADSALILPIYFAREENDGTISSTILANEINKHSHNAEAFETFEKAEEYLKSKISNMNSKNIIVTMGAGEAYKIGDNLLIV